MSESCGDCYDYALAKERFEDAFAEVCSEIWNTLCTKDRKYAEMWRELLALIKTFPVLPVLTEGEGAVSLSAEEHKAFQAHLFLRTQAQLRLSEIDRSDLTEL